MEYMFPDYNKGLINVISSLEKYFAKKKKKPEKPELLVITDKEAQNRKNQNNLNVNVNFSGFTADAEKSGKGVFTADAAKTLPREFKF